MEQSSCFIFLLSVTVCQVQVDKELEVVGRGLGSVWKSEIMLSIH